MTVLIRSPNGHMLFTVSNESVRAYRFALFVLFGVGLLWLVGGLVRLRQGRQ